MRLSDPAHQARGWRRLGTDAQGGQNNRHALAWCPLRSQLWANNPGVPVSHLGLQALPPPSASVTRGPALPTAYEFQSPLHIDLMLLMFI